LALVSLGLAACAPHPPVHQPKTLRVVGYVPEYRYGGHEWWEGVLGKLTDVILFSIEATEDGHLSGLDRLPDAELLESIRSTARRSSTNVLICVGGSGRSEGLAKALRSTPARETLVRSLAELVDSTEVQGLDIDFEVPSGDDDYRALGDFLKDLKSAIPGRLVTLPIHPGQEQQVLRHGILETVDFVSEMAYDNFCHFPPTDPPCRHSTLEFSDLIVRHLTSLGLDTSKILLGLPFYGRDMQNGEAKTYGELLEMAMSERGYDGGDEVSGFSFNGPRTLAQKVDLASRSNLGGVMIWEVGQDAPLVAADDDGDEDDEEERSLLASVWTAATQPAGRLRRKRQNKRRNNKQEL